MVARAHTWSCSVWLVTPSSSAIADSASSTVSAPCSVSSQPARYASAEVPFHDSSSALIPVFSDRRPFTSEWQNAVVQLRYQYRLYPSPGQQISLARAFGCARVVFNDALAARGVKGLARTRLAKSVHDAGWAMFARLLEEKAVRAGRYFAKVDRFYPSSQICAPCGHRDGPKPLHVRVWTCPACGAVLNRDLNAANNILAAGRAERLNACGGRVSPGLAPALAGEAGTHR